MSAVNTIGLDIGSTSIRAIEATRTKDRTVVVNNFGQALLPPGAVSGGVINDDRAVTSALRHMWTRFGFRSKDVTLGILNQQAIVREVDVTNVPMKEMRQTLAYQVRDVLPMPAEDALLDFYPLEKPTKRDTIHGLLIAAPKDAVITTVLAVERAGLHVVQVDLASFAALRAAGRINGETEAIIDVGASATNIIIHTDGIPHIVRSIPRGGAEITRMMANRMGLEPEEAELVKCRSGLRPEEGSENAEVVREAVRPLINEIRSSLNYYDKTQQNRPVSQLALVGGGANLPGLTEALTDALGVRSYLSDPLQHVNDSRRGGRHDILGRYGSSAAVSIGLTLGAA